MSSSNSPQVYELPYNRKSEGSLYSSSSNNSNNDSGLGSSPVFGIINEQFKHMSNLAGTNNAKSNRLTLGSKPVQEYYRYIVDTLSDDELNKLNEEVLLRLLYGLTLEKIQNTESPDSISYNERLIKKILNLDFFKLDDFWHNYADRIVSIRPDISEEDSTKIYHALRAIKNHKHQYKQLAEENNNFRAVKEKNHQNRKKLLDIIKRFSRIIKGATPSRKDPRIGGGRKKTNKKKSKYRKYKIKNM
jgi:hypothetical protein